MQEILDWLLAHPVFTVLILLSVIGSGSGKRNKKKGSRRKPYPRPDVSADSSSNTSHGEQKEEKDWMAALRDLVKDPTDPLHQPKRQIEGRDRPLSREEKEIPERFRDVRVSSTSPASAAPPPLLPQETLQLGSLDSLPRKEWDEGSVFSKELVSGGGYSGSGGLAPADVGNLRETQAFSNQGGDLVFESALDNMELEADHSSAWGVAVIGDRGGLDGLDPKVLILGQLLLGPPRGLRTYEEEAMLPGMEA